MSGCRSCGAGALETVLDFGASPVADRLVPRDRLDRPPGTFPLTVALCPRCSLLQLVDSLDPGRLFGDGYPYLSSVADTVVANAADNVREVMAAKPLGPDTPVVELASNDGYLLAQLQSLGVPVLGIDPARQPVIAARERGVPTLQAFFDRDLAARLLRDRGPAHVIFANNVLAHVPDLNGFVDGIRTLLHPDGWLRVEVPYVVDLVDRNEFDTIYHQHLCYFSVATLDALFRRHALYLRSVRRIPIHGGSLRLTVGHRDEPDGSVAAHLDAEADRGFNEPARYQAFAREVDRLAGALRTRLRELKARGHRIAAYGAAAKATTLLHVSGVDHRLLDYVVDRNPVKHGLYLDGPRLEVRPTETLLEDRPDYVLLLAWNHADEILAQQQAYREAGGRFIVPIPEPAIL